MSPTASCTPLRERALVRGRVDGWTGVPWVVYPWACHGGPVLARPGMTCRTRDDDTRPRLQGPGSRSKIQVQDQDPRSRSKIKIQGQDPRSEVKPEIRTPEIWNPGIQHWRSYSLMFALRLRLKGSRGENDPDSIQSTCTMDTMTYCIPWTQF